MSNEAAIVQITPATGWWCVYEAVLKNWDRPTHTYTDRFHVAVALWALLDNGKVIPLCGSTNKATAPKARLKEHKLIGVVYLPNGPDE